MNTQSARNVKEFVHVLSRDDQGRPTRLLVPGHEGRRYQVSLSRNGGLVAHCEQLGYRDHSPMLPVAICEGSLHNICYHILAACMAAAEEQSKEIRWSLFDEADTKRAAAILDDQVFSVKSAQSGKVAWGIVLGGEPEPELAEAGLSKDALIALALRTTADKAQWFTGEVVHLTDDAFLKNDGDIVRLYRTKKPRALAVIYRLDFQANCWKPQAQLTPAQAKTELYDGRDSALPVQRERGRNKLFKT